MRRRSWLGSWLGAGLGVIVGVAPALAETPAKLGSAAIQGDAVVGSTLTAVVVAAGDPAPTISYEWARCNPDEPSQCLPVAGAKSATYTVTADDIAHTMVVRVSAKNSGGTARATSPGTAAVVAAPDPALTPDPTATAPTTSPALAIDFLTAPVQAPVAVSAPTAALYLRPFPVIRVAGSSVSGGAYINLLRVTGPRTTRVTVSCSGRGCPLRRLSRGPGRIRQLERFLPAGVAIAIRATRAGYIGKYVSFVVRSHAAPKRHDACLMPGRSRPAPCP